MPRPAPVSAERSRPRLRVIVTDEKGRPLDGGLGQWVTRVAPARARGVVNLAIVGDAVIRALNRQYRLRNRTTDVLSFPSLENDRLPGGRRLLGDIVIARGVARRQAAQAGHSLEAELRALALHGLLHLLGYDHERDSGEMEEVERRLRRKGRLRL
jgi:probable rRNA maturation factor